MALVWGGLCSAGWTIDALSLLRWTYFNKHLSELGILKHSGALHEDHFVVIMCAELFFISLLWSGSSFFGVIEQNWRGRARIFLDSHWELIRLHHIRKIRTVIGWFKFYGRWLCLVLRRLIKLIMVFRLTQACKNHHCLSRTVLWRPNKKTLLVDHLHKVVEIRWNSWITSL